VGKHRGIMKLNRTSWGTKKAVRNKRISMARCQIIVKDPQTKRYRKCRRNQKFGIICSCHAREYVVKIQAAWRSYRARSKINTFKELPSDLWGEVLNFVAKANKIEYVNDNMYRIYKSHIMVYHRRCEARKRVMMSDVNLSAEEILRMQDDSYVDIARIKWFMCLEAGHAEQYLHYIQMVTQRRY